MTSQNRKDLFAKLDKIQAQTTIIDNDIDGLSDTSTNALDEIDNLVNKIRIEIRAIETGRE